MNKEAQIHAAGRTDVGQRRGDNQDQFLIAELRKSMQIHSTSLPLDKESTLFGGRSGQLLVVADGMGGHAAGRRASNLAIDHLIAQLLNNVHWFLHLDEDHDEAFIESLKALLQQTHTKLLSESKGTAEHRGMGTTLTLSYIVWPRMYVVHAGDSRCYLIRNGKCKQLTTDHTLAKQLVDAGGMKPEDEAGSRWSNVLWNVLGGHGRNDLIAEVHRVELEENDTVVLCSDGLTRYIDEAALLSVVNQYGDDIEAMTDHLITLANGAGGVDNITVVVSRPRAAEAPSSQDDPPRSVPLVSLDDESDLQPDSDESMSLEELQTFANEDTLPDER
ncbi:Protein serine/threonine phosphatase PrpC, regulation of stationary phase [Rhodopirellula islandica]|uniref:Protein serine/threonine phosphatase PrpC, regulation of stationary phase n=2 Tax=Rhodopirellula islandica TaxID=595434 RepID=A0A0J1B9E1_RHOIS|nr:Protein serine/threonine phosphatase PrpC, regulation of stationary phase [Rhodopirellula islandica]